MSQPDPLLVQAVAAKLLEQLGQTSSPLMGAVWAAYWETSGRHCDSARDIRGCWRRLNAYPFTDGRRLDQVRAAELDVMFPARYREWRGATTTRRGKAPMPATVNRELERLRAVLNWAVEAGQLPPHPLQRIRMVAEDNVKETKIGSGEDFESLLRACGDAHDVLPALVLLYFDAGLRRLEGMRARWDELEAKSGGGGRLRLPGRKTKSGKPRYAHLTARTWTEVQALPRISDWVFANTSTEKKHRRHRGRPYSPGYLYRRFQDAVAASGLQAAEGETITLHTLRHSFAYRARRLWKWSEPVIMRQGGWSTRAAFDRYGIVDDEEQDEAMVAAESALARERRKAPHRAAPHVPESLPVVTKK
ncbi:MAG: tyrosine-type recombinase/integrase [Frankia sp.]|nr:tyrosine-type recombinase/integrase [Frankia sp.]